MDSTDDASPGHCVDCARPEVAQPAETQCGAHLHEASTDSVPRAPSFDGDRAASAGLRASLSNGTSGRVTSGHRVVSTSDPSTRCVSLANVPDAQANNTAINATGSIRYDSWAWLAWHPLAACAPQALYGPAWCEHGVHYAQTWSTFDSRFADCKHADTLHMIEAAKAAANMKAQQKQRAM